MSRIINYGRDNTRDQIYLTKDINTVDGVRYFTTYKYFYTSISESNGVKIFNGCAPYSIANYYTGSLETSKKESISSILMLNEDAVQNTISSASYVNTYGFTIDFNFFNTNSELSHASFGSGYNVLDTTSIPRTEAKIIYNDGVQLYMYCIAYDEETQTCEFIFNKEGKLSYAIPSANSLTDSSLYVNEDDVADTRSVSRFYADCVFLRGYNSDLSKRSGAIHWTKFLDACNWSHNLIRSFDNTKDYTTENVYLKQFNNISTSIIADHIGTDDDTFLITYNPYLLILGPSIVGAVNIQDFTPGVYKDIAGYWFALKAGEPNDGIIRKEITIEHSEYNTGDTELRHNFSGDDFIYTKRDFYANSNTSAWSTSTVPVVELNIRHNNINDYTYETNLSTMRGTDVILQFIPNSYINTYIKSLVRGAGAGSYDSSTSEFTDSSAGVSFRALYPYNSTEFRTIKYEARTSSLPFENTFGSITYNNIDCPVMPCQNWELPSFEVLSDSTYSKLSANNCIWSSLDPRLDGITSQITTGFKESNSTSGAILEMNGSSGLLLKSGEIKSELPTNNNKVVGHIRDYAFFGTIPNIRFTDVVSGTTIIKSANPYNVQNRLTEYGYLNGSTREYGDSFFNTSIVKFKTTQSSDSVTNEYSSDYNICDLPAILYTKFFFRSTFTETTAQLQAFPTNGDVIFKSQADSSFSIEDGSYISVKDVSFTNVSPVLPTWDTEVSFSEYTDITSNLQSLTGFTGYTALGDKNIVIKYNSTFNSTWPITADPTSIYDTNRLYGMVILHDNPVNSTYLDDDNPLSEEAGTNMACIAAQFNYGGTTAYYAFYGDQNDYGLGSAIKFDGAFGLSYDNNDMLNYNYNDYTPSYKFLVAYTEQTKKQYELLGPISIVGPDTEGHTVSPNIKDYETYYYDRYSVQTISVTNEDNHFYRWVFGTNGLFPALIDPATGETEKNYLYYLEYEPTGPVDFNEVLNYVWYIVPDTESIDYTLYDSYSSGVPSTTKLAASGSVCIGDLVEYIRSIYTTTCPYTALFKITPAMWDETNQYWYYIDGFGATITSAAYPNAFDTSDSSQAYYMEQTTEYNTFVPDPAYIYLTLTAEFRPLQCAVSIYALPTSTGTGIIEDLTGADSYEVGNIFTFKATGSTDTPGSECKALYYSTIDSLGNITYNKIDTTITNGVATNVTLLGEYFRGQLTADNKNIIDFYVEFKKHDSGFTFSCDYTPSDVSLTTNTITYKWPTSVTKDMPITDMVYGFSTDVFTISNMYFSAPYAFRGYYYYDLQSGENILLTKNISTKLNLDPTFTTNSLIAKVDFITEHISLSNIKPDGTTFEDASITVDGVTTDSFNGIHDNTYTLKATPSDTTTYVFTGWYAIDGDTRTLLSTANPYSYRVNSTETTSVSIAAMWEDLSLTISLQENASMSDIKLRYNKNDGSWSDWATSCSGVPPKAQVQIKLVDANLFSKDKDTPRLIVDSIYKFNDLSKEAIDIIGKSISEENNYIIYTFIAGNTWGRNVIVGAEVEQCIAFLTVTPIGNGSAHIYYEDKTLGSITATSLWVPVGVSVNMVAEPISSTTKDVVASRVSYWYIGTDFTTNRLSTSTIYTYKLTKDNNTYLTVQNFYVKFEDAYTYVTINNNQKDKYGNALCSILTNNGWYWLNDTLTLSATNIKTAFSYWDLNNKHLTSNPTNITITESVASPSLSIDTVLVEPAIYLTTGATPSGIATIAPSYVNRPILATLNESYTASYDHSKYICEYWYLDSDEEENRIRNSELNDTINLTWSWYTLSGDHTLYAKITSYDIVLNIVSDTQGANATLSKYYAIKASGINQEITVSYSFDEEVTPFGEPGYRYAGYKYLKSDGTYFKSTGTIIDLSEMPTGENTITAMFVKNPYCKLTFNLTGISDFDINGTQVENESVVDINSNTELTFTLNRANHRDYKFKFSSDSIIRVRWSSLTYEDITPEVNGYIYTYKFILPTGLEEATLTASIQKTDAYVNITSNDSTLFKMQNEIDEYYFLNDVITFTGSIASTIVSIKDVLLNGKATSGIIKFGAKNETALTIQGRYTVSEKYTDEQVFIIEPIDADICITTELDKESFWDIENYYEFNLQYTYGISGTSTEFILTSTSGPPFGLVKYVLTRGDGSTVEFDAASSITVPFVRTISGVEIEQQVLKAYFEQKAVYVQIEKVSYNDIAIDDNTGIAIYVLNGEDYIKKADSWCFDGDIIKLSATVDDSASETNVYTTTRPARFKRWYYIETTTSATGEEVTSKITVSTDADYIFTTNSQEFLTRTYYAEFEYASAQVRLNIVGDFTYRQPSVYYTQTSGTLPETNRLVTSGFTKWLFIEPSTKYISYSTNFRFTQSIVTSATDESVKPVRINYWSINGSTYASSVDGSVSAYNTTTCTAYAEEALYFVDLPELNGDGVADGSVMLYTSNISTRALEQITEPHWVFYKDSVKYSVNSSLIKEANLALNSIEYYNGSYWAKYPKTWSTITLGFDSYTASEYYKNIQNYITNTTTGIIRLKFMFYFSAAEAWLSFTNIGESGTSTHNIAYYGSSTSLQDLPVSCEQICNDFEYKWLDTYTMFDGWYDTTNTTECTEDNLLSTSYTLSYIIPNVPQQHNKITAKVSSPDAILKLHSVNASLSTGDPVLYSSPIKDTLYSSTGAYIPLNTVYFAKFASRTYTAYSNNRENPNSCYSIVSRVYYKKDGKEINIEFTNVSISSGSLNGVRFNISEDMVIGGVIDLYFDYKEYMHSITFDTDNFDLFNYIKFNGITLTKVPYTVKLYHNATFSITTEPKNYGSQSINTVPVSIVNWSCDHGNYSPSLTYGGSNFTTDLSITLSAAWCDKYIEYTVQGTASDKITINNNNRWACTKANGGIYSNEEHLNISINNPTSKEEPPVYLYKVVDYNTISYTTSDITRYIIADDPVFAHRRFKTDALYTSNLPYTYNRLIIMAYICNRQISWSMKGTGNVSITSAPASNWFYLPDDGSSTNLNFTLLERNYILDSVKPSYLKTIYINSILYETYTSTINTKTSTGIEKSIIIPININQSDIVFNIAELDCSYIKFKVYNDAASTTYYDGDIKVYEKRPYYSTIEYSKKELDFGWAMNNTVIRFEPDPFSMYYEQNTKLYDGFAFAPQGIPVIKDGHNTYSKYKDAFYIDSEGNTIIIDNCIFTVITTKGDYQIVYFRFIAMYTKRLIINIDTSNISSDDHWYAYNSYSYYTYEAGKVVVPIIFSYAKNRSYLKSRLGYCYDALYNKNIDTILSFDAYGSKDKSGHIVLQRWVYRTFEHIMDTSAEFTTDYITVVMKPTDVHLTLKVENDNSCSAAAYAWTKQYLQEYFLTGETAIISASNNLGVRDASGTTIGNSKIVRWDFESNTVARKTYTGEISSFTFPINVDDGSEQTLIAVYELVSNQTGTTSQTTTTTTPPTYSGGDAVEDPDFNPESPESGLTDDGESSVITDEEGGDEDKKEPPAGSTEPPTGGDQPPTDSGGSGGDKHSTTTNTTDPGKPGGSSGGSTTEIKDSKKYYTDYTERYIKITESGLPIVKGVTCGSLIITFVSEITGETYTITIKYPEYLNGGCIYSCTPEVDKIKATDYTCTYGKSIVSIKYYVKGLVITHSEEYEYKEEVVDLDSDNVLSWIVNWDYDYTSPYDTSGSFRVRGYFADGTHPSVYVAGYTTIGAQVSIDLAPYYVWKYTNNNYKFKFELQYYSYASNQYITPDVDYWPDTYGLPVIADPGDWTHLTNLDIGNWVQELFNNAYDKSTIIENYYNTITNDKKAYILNTKFNIQVVNEDGTYYTINSYYFSIYAKTFYFDAANRVHISNQYLPLIEDINGYIDNAFTPALIPVRGLSTYKLAGASKDDPFTIATTMQYDSEYVNIIKNTGLSIKPLYGDLLKDQKITLSDWVASDTKPYKTGIVEYSSAEGDSNEADSLTISATNVIGMYSNETTITTPIFYNWVEPTITIVNCYSWDADNKIVQPLPDLNNSIYVEFTIDYESLNNENTIDISANDIIVSICEVGTEEWQNVIVYSKDVGGKLHYYAASPASTLKPDGSYYVKIQYRDYLMRWYYKDYLSVLLEVDSRTVPLSLASKSNGQQNTVFNAIANTLNSNIEVQAKFNSSIVYGKDTSIICTNNGTSATVKAYDLLNRGGAKSVVADAENVEANGFVDNIVLLDYENYAKLNDKERSYETGSLFITTTTEE